MNEKPRRNNRKTLRNVIIGMAIVLLFAYAIDVTKVNLDEPMEPKRQENLVTLLRELARPDFFDHRNETRSTVMSVRMPCPQQPNASQIAVEGRQLLMTPNCATTTQDRVRMEGQGFPANVDGVILWYPAGSETTRRLSEFRADDNGNFGVTFTFPDIRETEEPQRIEVVEVLSSTISGFSTTSKDTFQRMIETVLMALMASTLGTILAVPISFLGARNLMEDVDSPLAAIMASLVALPIGAYAGGQIGRGVSGIASGLGSSLIFSFVGLLVTVALGYLLLRYGDRLLGGKRSGVPGWFAFLRVVLAVLLGVLALGLLAQVGLVAGDWLRDTLGFFGFIGNFIYVISDLIRLALVVIVGLLGAGAAMSLAGRLAQEAVLRMGEGPARVMTAVLTFLGTAIILFGLLYAANWICLLGLCHSLPQDTSSLLLTLAVPSAIVGLIAALFSLRTPPRRAVGIGMVIYTVTRTILNVLRAIEPVIMGFVLVIWVGIGPFAGVMALMLHSVADLGKLFSEQVENIDEGPVEAVTATGANRLQTISFAVVPQIVPQYLAFIFYRWDINVRLSTIIGFVGGGGIGLLLFRSTNLTQYSQAAVMVIAIAVVVTLLDYVSSKVRTRII
jgi:phosphonate ABC transporter permease subunit PhnE